MTSGEEHSGQIRNPFFGERDAERAADAARPYGVCWCGEPRTVYLITFADGDQRVGVRCTIGHDPDGDHDDVHWSERRRPLGPARLLQAGDLLVHGPPATDGYMARLLPAGDHLGQVLTIRAGAPDPTTGRMPLLIDLPDGRTVEVTWRP